MSEVWLPVGAVGTHDILTLLKAHSDLKFGDADQRVLLTLHGLIESLRDWVRWFYNPSVTELPMKEGGEPVRIRPMGKTECESIRDLTESFDRDSEFARSLELCVTVTRYWAGGSKSDKKPSVKDQRYVLGLLTDAFSHLRISDATLEAA